MLSLYVLVIIGVLVVSILMWILLSTFISFINGAGLESLNVSGTVTDYSWAGKLFIIVYVLAAALLPLAVLVYVISHYVGRKH